MSSTPSTLTPISSQGSPSKPTQPTSFSTSRQLFSQHLAQLVTSFDTASPVTENEQVASQIKRAVEESFGEGDETDQPTKQPWRTDTRRIIIERALDELVQQSAEFPATAVQPKQLESALDLILAFVEAGYVDENVPLQTLAGLMELRPISACEPLLGYIETRVERLTKGMEYQRGRGPILLRLLNDLLRRLPRSKSGPVILSGRILMLLSSVYPLGEKSGVNLRGNFNIGKGTVWEQQQERTEQKQAKEEVPVESEEKGNTGDGETEVEKMEVEEGEEEEGEQGKEGETDAASTSPFYSTFWSLQKFFNNPHLLFASTSTSATSPVETLHSSLLTVLTAFSGETKKEKELSGSTVTKEDQQNGKGKQVATGDSTAQMMVTGEKDSLDKTEESLEQYFFPKFLTSRNLLTLELSDPTFRLQLLLQTLILTQYLLSLTPSARARAQALPLTNTSAFPNFVLGPEEEKQVLEVQDKSWKEVENMQGGQKVRRAIEGILQRERNWTDWKLRSCLPFTKPSLPTETVSSTASTKLRNMTRPPPRFPYKLGNPRLSRVWSNDLKTLEGFEPDVTDDEFDSIVREWRMTKKKLEMTRAQIKQVGPSHPKASELQASLEPMTIKLQALHFRALRSASTTYLRHFSKIGSGDLEKLLEEIEKERRKREEEEEAREVEAELKGKTVEEVSEEAEETKANEEDEEKTAAIRLGDTPKRKETIEEEKIEDNEAGTPPPPTTSKKEPDTPKRPREDSTEEAGGEGAGDTEMKDAQVTKKQKV